jgi:hypothetical protein
MSQPVARAGKRALIRPFCRGALTHLAEIKRDRKNASGQDSGATLIDLKRSTSAQYADVNKCVEAKTRADIANGRMTFVSPGRCLSFAPRTLQYDSAHFGAGDDELQEIQAGTVAAATILFASASAALMPSTPAERIPPANPAPSPAG